MEEMSRKEMLRRWKDLEEKIGYDDNDFIPVYGVWNYSKRAWLILRNINEEYYGADS